MIFSTKIENETVEGIANFEIKGDVLKLDKLHVSGSASGNVGIKNLYETARQIGRRYGVKKVYIQGGKRTTGKFKGTIPKPVTIKVD